MVSLVEQMRAKAAQAAEAIRGRYLDLLGRNDRPEAGDLEELERTLRAMGKTPADLERDLRVVRQVRQLRDELSDQDAARQAEREANGSLMEHRRESERIQAERMQQEGALIQAVLRARERGDRCRMAAADLERIVRDRPDLFGGDRGEDRAEPVGRMARTAGVIVPLYQQVRGLDGTAGSDVEAF